MIGALSLQGDQNAEPKFELETDVALSLLCEPALMVNSHGAMKFDHAGYRQMADHGWRCVMHTETPIDAC